MTVITNIGDGLRVVTGGQLNDFDPKTAAADQARIKLDKQFIRVGYRDEPLRER